jgi:DNA-binding HxlR family transcriptional regulator
LAAEQRFHHFPVAHFCPLARTLDILGERWAFLIVRDLLRGPQRFTDLQRYLAGITPKRLSAHLRALEGAGIVERDQVAGRREVWYRLTPTGRELGPALEVLAAWGMAHALRPPAPGQVIYPEQAITGIRAYLRQRGPRPARPTTWQLRFSDAQVFTIRYDDAGWTTRPGDTPQPDVRVTATPEDWVAFLAARPDEREQFARVQIEGTPERVAELLAALPEGAAP